MTSDFPELIFPELIFPDWPAPEGVKACATTRRVSSGAVHTDSRYDFFNTGDHVGDNPAVVEQNRRHLLDNMPGCSEIRWLQQVHGTDCVDASEESEGVVRADASFSDTPRIACTVMTADCLPVLFCNHHGTQVAAAHAGWRGLADGVLLRTLDRFTDSSEVIVWLGPAISASHFEVGPEVAAAFSDIAGNEAAFREGNGDRLYADLYVLARLQLEAAGVSGIYGGDFCTHSDRERFYSYRRDGVTGRMASCIWLAGS